MATSAQSALLRARLSLDDAILAYGRAREESPIPALDVRVIDAYQQVGSLIQQYTDAVVAVVKAGGQ